MAIYSRRKTYCIAHAKTSPFRQDREMGTVRRLYEAIYRASVCGDSDEWSAVLQIARDLIEHLGSGSENPSMVNANCDAPRTTDAPKLGLSSLFVRLCRIRAARFMFWIGRLFVGCRKCWRQRSSLANK